MNGYAKRTPDCKAKVTVPTSSYYFTEMHDQAVSTNNHMLDFFDQVRI